MAILTKADITGEREQKLICLAAAMSLSRDINKAWKTLSLRGDQTPTYWQNMDRVS